ncbi:hypothetical protein GIW50_14160 [Pseudomonas syringae]|nr:hypothetical protein [Pseudomonas syringae]MCF5075611.1 hypothetical protein [Pseudomonas syringae]MCF5119538.1 hypothetical protein [Pseudomonas syringae]MCF5379709.1 hypothetical protein [Pseudomonas syringae]
MSDIKYVTEDYSKTYLSLMKSALENSLDFNFDNKPRISITEKIDQELLEFIAVKIEQNLIPHLLRIHPTYWGNSCQLLSSHIFAYLASKGIDAEIVYGEVEINGTLEFDTTLQGLKREFHSDPPLAGGQALHAWVSLGGDIIIDAAIPDRMIKLYQLPSERLPLFLIGRASELSRTFRTRYQPLLVGTDFLARTNPPDPLKLIDYYSE